jgi:hypothetical protein
LKKIFANAARSSYDHFVSLGSPTVIARTNKNDLCCNDVAWGWDFGSDWTLSGPSAAAAWATAIETCQNVLAISHCFLNSADSSGVGVKFLSELETWIWMANGTTVA